MPLITIKKDISSNKHIAGKITPYKIDFGLFSKVIVKSPGGTGGYVALVYSDDSAFSTFTKISETKISSAQTIQNDISAITGEYYVGLIYDQGGTSTSTANMSVTNNIDYFTLTHRNDSVKISECYFEV